VSLLREGFSFHFPANGSLAAQSVPVRREIASNNWTMRFAMEFSGMSVPLFRACTKVANRERSWGRRRAIAERLAIYWWGVG
jgi:hypothetical protein